MSDSPLMGSGVAPVRGITQFLPVTHTCIHK